MFLYLMTMIPCDWIAKIQVLACVASSNDGSSACLTAVNETTEIFQVSIIATHLKLRLTYTRVMQLKKIVDARKLMTTTVKSKETKNTK